MQNIKRFLEWNYSYTVLLMCWFGWIFIYFGRSTLPAVLPLLVGELKITHAEAGMFSTSFLMGYTLIKIPVGFLVRRIGIKKTLILSMIGYGIFTMINGLATSFLQILILRFFLGFFQGIHLPVANTLISERFGSRQGKAIGFHESGPNIGNALTIPLAASIASTWGWRSSFLLLSLPALTLALTTFLALKEEGKEDAIRAEVRLKPDDGLRSFLRFLAPLAMAQAVYDLCMHNLFNFTPIYLVEFRGMELTMAGFIAMIIPATGFISKISSGFIAERFGTRGTICLATTLTGIFILALAFFTSEYEIIFIFILIGLVLYLFSPVVYTAVTAVLPFSLKTMGLGVVTTIGGLTGAVSAPIVGYVIDVQGYNTAFLSISLIVLITSAMIYMIMKREELNTIH